MSTYVNTETGELYVRSDGADWLVKNALTLARLWFYDGTMKTFYSLDRTKKSKVPVKEAGIFKLKKGIDQQETLYGGLRCAIIYDRESNQEIHRKMKGVWVK